MVKRMTTYDDNDVLLFVSAATGITTGGLFASGFSLLGVDDSPLGCKEE